MEEKLSYVGISCLTTMAQVEQCARLAYQLPHHRLALGFQVSDKTLRGESNKYPHMYPRVADLPELFSRRWHNVELHIHFSPDTGDGLGEKLVQLAELCGPLLDGVQINFPWPNEGAIGQFRAACPWARVILQIDDVFLWDEANGQNYSPGWFASIFHRPYSGLTTDVLFDLSGGKGVAVDVARAGNYLEAIRNRCHHPAGPLGLGVAGGLGPETVGRLVPLVERLHRLSWDAQSSFFDEKKEFRLDWATRYVVSSAGLAP